MNLKKRLPLYLAGVVVMAAGIVLINKSDLGSTPISAIPLVLSKILAGRPFWSYGLLTLMFHTACMLLQLLAAGRIRIMILLEFPLALGFSWVLGFMMDRLRLGEPSLWLRIVLLAAGMVLTALGIVLVVQTDMVLTAPDALLRTLSQRLHIELYKVKITGDILWTMTALIISIVYLYRGGLTSALPLLAAACSGRLSVGIGTLLSMYGIGRLVGLFKKWLKGLEMPPFEPSWRAWRAERAHQAD